MPKKTTKPKAVNGWLIATKHGPLWSTFRLSRSKCIADSFPFHDKDDWLQIYNKGYRCVRAFLSLK